jgi:hypothetical protein
MSLPIKKITRYAICVIISLAFVSPAKSSYSAEPAPIISAFYCSSKEIDFIGELIPPVLSIMEDNKVKTELDLSDSQIEKMREMDKVFFAGVKDVLNSSENRGSELLRNGRKIEDHVIAIGKLSEDARKYTNEILKPHQLARMKELLLQLKGGVLTIPKKDLRQLLRLDRKQEKEIDEIRSFIFKRIDETASPASVITSVGRCKFATSTDCNIAISLEQSEKLVYSLLSPEQQATIEKYKGKSFSFTERILK